MIATMSCLSWNCRGMGQPRTVQALHLLVKERKLIFVFLMETLSSKKKLESIWCRLGFAGLFVVDPIGRSGGLALFWKDVQSLEIFNYSRSHIHAVIKDSEGAPQWQFTGFYGQPDVTRRNESWVLLKHLKTLLLLPWLCTGDFNEIVVQFEKTGAALRRDSQMAGFRDALEVCDLSDLGYVDPRFTWCNHRRGDSFSMERLDRVVANLGWCSRFPAAEVFVLPACTSDHHPLLISLNEFLGVRTSFRCGFKFEAAWVQDVECQGLIKSIWEASFSVGNPVLDVQEKLSACQQKLSSWSRRKFGRTAAVLKQKNSELLKLQSRANPSFAAGIKLLQKEIEEILDREDLKRKQRAKQSWYVQRDRNTKFFHSWANQRRKTNRIQSRTDAGGRIWKEDKEVSTIFLDYFETLFRTQNPTGIDQCLDNLESRVTPAMNDSLTRPFLEDEIQFALSQMHPLKSPGPDGYSAGFYQNSWDIVRPDVTRAALYFLNGGHLEEGLNDTNICLVPKVSSPTKVTDYRPISLCNVFYKLISKVLANRLKHVLPTIISPEQSAFIPGRLITDNILVAFETLHTMDTRLKGREGFMALKLDMSKAYDRLEWDFLEAMLRKLGFAPRWIHFLVTCVRTVTYSTLINGQPNGRIVLSHGIRQGDPLSPYFFIICAEAISSMLQYSVRNGDITGVPISRGGTCIHHLFFAEIVYYFVVLI